MPYDESIEGFMTVPDFNVIEALAACVPEGGTAVEVGSFLGKSADAWARSVDPSVRVVCIDPWPEDKKEIFLKNTAHLKNIVPMQTYSPPENWDEKVDLVFIDGNHFSPHVDNDIEFWWKHLQPEGILCGHDFSPTLWPDVCAAVARFARKVKKPILLFENSSIWCLEYSAPQTKKMSASRLFLKALAWEAPEHLQNIDLDVK